MFPGSRERVHWEGMGLTGMFLADLELILPMQLVNEKNDLK